MMAEPIGLENRVFAFLNHLGEDKRAREHVEHVLLKELVRIAEREGYDFSAEDFKNSVTVQVHYGLEFIKWPPGHT